jgi:outer membrane scaffolding protein for murein synthesis (MipA/OmpV family)
MTAIQTAMSNFVAMSQQFRASAVFVQMRTRDILLRLATAAPAAALFTLVAPAAAQSNDAPPEPRSDKRFTVMIGGGAQVTPKYPGADSYQVTPLPLGGLRRAGTPIPSFAPDDAIGFKLFGESATGFSFGPAARLIGKRKPADVGADVDRVGFTVEAGAFAQYMVTPNIRVRVEGRKGLGGHKGWVGNVGADLVLRDQNSYIFSVGPRARFGDNRYTDAYFGVSPAAAARTALPAYNPGSGLYAVGAITGLTYRMGPRWGFQLRAGYDRLVGDAGRSPIVRTLGSRDQFQGGGGVFFEFDM